KSNNVDEDEGELTRKTIPEQLQSKIYDLESEGKTVVIVCMEDKYFGLIAIADTIRENAKYVVDEIKQMGKDVIIMSGDNQRTATTIAKKLGISKVLSQVLPEIKAQEIKKLQNQGKKIAMI